MRSVHGNFRQRLGPARWLWWMLALLSAAAFAMASIAWREARGIEKQQQLLREAQIRSTAAAIAPPPPASAPQYASSAREMLAERQFPWTQALTSIEATAIVGVTPVAIEFAASDRVIRLEVNFADYGKLLEYVDALNAGEPELHWILSQSQSLAVGAFSAVIVGRRQPRK